MIISTNEGGICNRIKSWISCIRYATENKIECKIQWKVISDYNDNKHILNCKFKDLFSNNCEIQFLPKKIEQTYNSHCFRVFDKDNIPHNFSKFTSNCKRKFTKNDSKNRNFDFEYLRIPRNVINNYLPYFKYIKLQKDILTLIEDFSQKFTKDTVSLHIRSWCLPNEETRSELHSIDKIKSVLNKYKCKEIFLVSDDKNMKDNFGEYNIITYNRKSDINRDNTLSIKEDLIELFLLSKNNTMILSHFSTFSEVAWWLGGCSRNITIV